MISTVDDNSYVNTNNAAEIEGSSVAGSSGIAGVIAQRLQLPEE